jgi:hypothetical protein
MYHFTQTYSTPGFCLFLFGLLFDPKDEAYVPPKRRDFCELYGVTTYETALFKYFSLQHSFVFPDGISSLQRRNNISEVNGKASRKKK